MSLVMHVCYRRTAAARRLGDTLLECPVFWGRAAVVKCPAYSRFARPGCIESRWSGWFGDEENQA